MSAHDEWRRALDRPAPGLRGTALVVRASARGHGWSADDEARYRALFEAFLAGRGRSTLRAYRQDLDDLRQFLGAPSVEQALGVLLGGGLGHANAVALAYRAHLLDRALAAATVNRRLAALRSVVKLGRTLGVVPWALEVEGVRGESYRDTRGPGATAVHQALAWLAEQDTPKARRDRALLRCLFDLGLRRGEASLLDLAHLDLDAGTLQILGKGRRDRESLTLPGPTRQALATWVQARGEAPGPLFIALDPASAGHRLTGTSIYKLVRRIGQHFGLRMRPHGLRHAAITEALERTGGDVRKCQRFSRHKDVRTLLRYDDNRRDFAGEVAALVAG